MEVAVAIYNTVPHALLNEQEAFEEIAGLPNQWDSRMRMRVHKDLLIVVVKIKDIDFRWLGLMVEFVGVCKVGVDYQIVLS